MKKTNLILTWLVFGIMIAFVGCSKNESNADARDSFVAPYKVLWTCTQSGNGDHSFVISKSTTDAKRVIISNLLGNGISSYAEVSGSSMTIPNQVIGAASVSGNGTLNNSALTITINVAENGGSQSCQLNANKQ